MNKAEEYAFGPYDDMRDKRIAELEAEVERLKQAHELLFQVSMAIGFCKNVEGSLPDCSTTNYWPGSSAI